MLGTFTTSKAELWGWLLGTIRTMRDGVERTLGALASEFPTDERKHSRDLTATEDGDDLRR